MIAAGRGRIETGTEDFNQLMLGQHNEWWTFSGSLGDEPSKAYIFSEGTGV
jgi:hypothetical protein